MRTRAEGGVEREDTQPWPSLCADSESDDKFRCGAVATTSAEKNVTSKVEGEGEAKGIAMSLSEVKKDGRRWPS